MTATQTTTRLIGRTDLPGTDKPSPAQRALLLAAADAPIEINCRNAKTATALIRRGWIVKGTSMTFDLTDAGLEAAVR